MTTVLIAGGAGYIGSEVARHFVDAGYKVVVLDNLSKGSIDLLPPEAYFHKIDLCDKYDLEDFFEENEIDLVVNCAGYKAAGESMKDAVLYSDNIVGMTNLLNCCVKHKIKKFIFSSSAGVYGTPKEEVVDENSPTNPINFYGYTKLVSEQLLEWYRKIHGLDYVALRYFNVAGDSGICYIDPDAQNIFPIIGEVIQGKRDKLMIFGNDYNTKDGTCVRDYIHVIDLANAHVLAAGVKYSEIINLGSGHGYSVMELVNEFAKLSGNNFQYEIVARRAGDPARLVSTNNKAKEILKWVPRHNLTDMVQSTLDAYKHNHSKTCC